jgi:hypothetical protein
MRLHRRFVCDPKKDPWTSHRSDGAYARVYCDVGPVLPYVESSYYFSVNCNQRAVI